MKRNLLRNLALVSALTAFSVNAETRYMQLTSVHQLVDGGKYVVGGVYDGRTDFPRYYNMITTGNNANKVEFKQFNGTDFEDTMVWELRKENATCHDTGHAVHSDIFSMHQNGRTILHTGTGNTIGTTDAATYPNSAWVEFFEQKHNSYGENDHIFTLHFNWNNNTSQMTQMRGPGHNGNFGQFSGLIAYNTPAGGTYWSTIHRVYLQIDSEDITAAAEVLFRGELKAKAAEYAANNNLIEAGVNRLNNAIADIALPADYAWDYTTVETQAATEADEAFEVLINGIRYMQLTNQHQLADGANYAISFNSTAWDAATPAFSRFFRYTPGANTDDLGQISLEKVAFSNIDNTNHVWTLRAVNRNDFRCGASGHEHNQVFRLEHDGRFISFPNTTNTLSLTRDSVSASYAEFIPCNSTHYPNQTLFYMATYVLNGKLVKAREANGGNNGNIGMASSDVTGIWTVNESFLKANVGTGNGDWSKALKIYLQIKADDPASAAGAFFNARLQERAAAYISEKNMDEVTAAAFNEEVAALVPPTDVTYNYFSVEEQAAEKADAAIQPIIDKYTVVAKSTLLVPFDARLDVYGNIPALWTAEAIAAAKEALAAAVADQPDEFSLGSAEYNACQAALEAAYPGVESSLIKSSVGKVVMFSNIGGSGRAGRLLSVNNASRMNAPSNTVNTLAQLWVIESCDDNNAYTLRNYLTGQYAFCANNNNGACNTTATAESHFTFGIHHINNKYVVDMRNQHGAHYLHCGNNTDGWIICYTAATSDAASGWEVRPAGELNDEHALASAEAVALAEASFMDTAENPTITFTHSAGLKKHVAVNYGDEHVITITRAAEENSEIVALAAENDGEVVATITPDMLTENTVEIEGATEGASATTTTNVSATLAEKLEAGDYMVNVPVNMFYTADGKFAKALSTPLKVNNDPTSIREIGTGDAEADEVYFDLSGRRVAAPAKGIYVTKSGRKVVF